MLVAIIYVMIIIIILIIMLTKMTIMMIMKIIRDVVSNGVGGTEYAQPMVEGGRGQIMVNTISFNIFDRITIKTLSLSS